jgi:hypothetical protein
MTKIEQRWKLIEAATQGEWKADNGSRYSDILVGAIEEGDEWGFVGENLLIADAALIVAAVNDYAALLDFVTDSAAFAEGRMDRADWLAALAKFEEKP